ncbi:MAG: hypothetical protein U0792_22875 [Gemmataceae bacterium]
MEPGAVGVRWWLWPNVLALDAPVVAVIWQRFLGDTFGVSVPVPASVVLGLVVWGIYLVDRRLDGEHAATNQPRHQFAKQRASLVTLLAVFAFLTAIVLAVTLPFAYLTAGGIVAILVAGYFALVHLVKAPLNGGKELLVGMLFAAGVAIPLLASGVQARAWLLALVGFGLACWLNCRLIERWETGSAQELFIESILGMFVVVCGAMSQRPITLALGATAVLLLLLHVLHRRIGSDAARVLADVALLTPILAWVFR